MLVSALFRAASVQPPPPRAAEARAAEEQPGRPLPRARAAAALPWQPGRPAPCAPARPRWRLRAQLGLVNSDWGQVRLPDVPGSVCLQKAKNVPRRAYERQSSLSRACGVGVWSPAMCAVLHQPKSVKLRALHSAQKFGIAARSCQELLRKGCDRFQVGRGLREGTPAASVRFLSAWMDRDRREAPACGLEARTVVRPSSLPVL